MLRKLIVVLGGLVILGTAAMAQSLYTLTNREVASIPFAFAVGNRVLPAGTYTFQINLEKRVLVIEDEQRRALMFFVDVGDLHKPPAHGQIVFRHLGDGFILKTVRTPDSSNEALLLRGAQEKRLASLEKADDTVAVLAEAR